MIRLDEIPGYEVRPRPKYGNRKVFVDGIQFDSQKEADRWADLCLLERAGEISALERQVPFLLLPARRRSDGKMEEETSYIADFTYYQGGRFVVEDVKGFRTDVYILKRKMMLGILNIEVKEI